MSGKGNDSGKGGKKKGYARTGKQLRYLFAMGILKHGAKGKSGKPGKAVYDRKAAQKQRPAVGGSKAAGLRGGSGSGKSRAERIAAGHAKAAALKGSFKNVGATTPKHERLTQTTSLGATTFGGRGAWRKDTLGTRARSVTPNAAGRFGTRMNGKAGELTRGERITAGNRRLEQFIGQRASAVRRNNPANRKEMASRRPGTYADTGKPFKAGDRIYYGNGQAYARKGTEGVQRLSLTLPSTPPKTRLSAVNRAAVTAAADYVNGGKHRAGQGGYSSSQMIVKFRKELKRLGMTGKGRSS